MFNILDNNNSELLNKIINYIFIKQRSLKSRFTCLDKNRLTKSDLNNKVIYYLIEGEDLKFVSVNIIDEISNYIQILFIGYENDNLFEKFILFLKENFKDYQCDVVLPKENLLCELLNKKQINNYGIDIHLELTKKIKIDKNKNINVMKMKSYLMDEYKELHNDEDRFWTSSKVLKSKSFDVLTVLYNNEMVGYIDLYKSEDFYEIYDLHIIDKVRKIDVIINQLFEYIFNNYSFKRIMIVLEEKSKYLNHLKSIGFNEYDNSICYYSKL